MLVHRWVTSSIKLVGTHLYTWVEGGTVGVECLAAQKHNTMSPAKARIRTNRSGVANHEATAPPVHVYISFFLKEMLSVFKVHVFFSTEKNTF